VHNLATGAVNGALFTDDIRCPIHVCDLAAALLELAASDAAGIRHLAGPDALSRHELGVLIAQRDGLDPSRLRAALRTESTVPGALDVRLKSQATQQHLRTTLRGAREFLQHTATAQRRGV
jgi:dTDP-4-dehydrorhamnose reductase